MGSRPMYIETVLTCEGNFYAPNFSNQLSMFCKKFESLITSDKQPLFYVKVEPWNSVRVWLQLPAEASERLKALANEQAAMLRDLGVLTVHIKEENSVVSFNLQSENAAESCSSAVSQDSADSSSVSVVNSLISHDSHYCKSQEFSEESQELSMLTRPRTDCYRNGYKESTLSVLADKERCLNSEACAELNQLSFHRKTAAETLGSNGKMLASRMMAESGCGISETGSSAFKTMTNCHSIASTLNGFHNRHLNDLHRLSEVQLRVGRQHGSKSFQQKSVRASPLNEQSSCDSPTLKQGCCLRQSQVIASSDSVTTTKNGNSTTLVEECEHVSSFSSNSGRQSRKRKSDDLDGGDARLSVLPSVVDDCHHYGSTDCNGSVAGDCNNATEHGTSLSFQNLPQHSTNVRCIINPYTGDMENVTDDDDDLVMPHGAESSAVPDHACYSASPALTVNDECTFGDFTISSNGHSVSIDADHIVSVNNFLQSILERLESSSSADHHLLNLLNSIVGNAAASQLLTESVAETERSIMRLLLPQMQAPRLNGIGHNMIDDHAKRQLSVPSNTVVSSLSNGRLGRDRECQKVSTDSGVTCKEVSNACGIHFGTESLQLQHSTEIASENASSQANSRYLMQQGAFGTVASLPSKLHQVEVEGCDSGFAVSQSDAGLKFQEDVHDDLGDMISTECQNVTQGMLKATASQQNLARNMQQAKHQSQSQQVKDTLRHASHELCQGITDFPPRNVVNDDACNELLKFAGSSKTASSTSSVDQLQRLFGTPEKTAFQMYAYRNANCLSQNMELSEQISSVTSADFQSTIARTDAVSSGKRLITRSTAGKEGTSDSSMDPVSAFGRYRLSDGDLLNGNLRHIPQTEASILDRSTLSASAKIAESPQPSARKCPIKKSKSCDRSKRSSLSVIGKSNSQASSSNNFVHGRQTKPVTKSQPTVAQLLDEARAKQAVSAGALVMSSAMSLANSTAVSSFLEAHAIGAWPKQMPNVALINLLPYSQPLSDFQCSALEMLPLSLPRSSPSVPSLIAVPLSSMGLPEPESGLQSGVSVMQGDPSHHHQHLSAFVFEHCQGLVPPSGLDLFNSMDMKQEISESGASTDSVRVKIESTSHSGSPGIDNNRATAAEPCCDAKDSAISAATFTVKQEL